MNAPIRYWRVTFAADGTVDSVSEIQGPGHASWVVIRALTEVDARHRAHRLWHARVMSSRRAAFEAAGKCRCGRERDSAGSKRCVRCLAQNRVHLARSRGNQPSAADVVKASEPRASDRLAVLLDVRKQWISARNVGLFGKWLAQEIAALTEGQDMLAKTNGTE